MALKLKDFDGVPSSTLLNAAICLGVQPIAANGQPSQRDDELVAALIKSGHTLATIKAIRPPASPAVAGVKVDEVVNAAVSALESKLRSHVGDIKSDMQDSIDRAVGGIKVPDVTADVAAAVAAAFKPIADAFNAAPVAVQTRIAASIPRQRKPIADVFGVAISGDCEIWGEPYGVDVDYVWDVRALALALRDADAGQNVWLWGMKGTGKTTFAQQFAGRLGRPFFLVPVDGTTEKSEVIGDNGIKGDGKGGTSSAWQDGAILQAYRTPGAICLLDEVDHARADNLTTLHTLCSKGSTYRVPKTGEIVHRAVGMMFFGAANTNGTGDESGEYGGTKSQNAALCDRFAHFPKLTFMPEQQEIDLLVKRGAPVDVATKLINVFKRCRAEVGGSLNEPPSLRRAFAFIDSVDLGADYAWEVSIVNNAPAVYQETLRQLFAAHYN